MVNAAQVNCMNDPQVFGRLLEDAEKPLYPGCMKYTKLSALVKLYNLKARYGWSDKGFSELLQLLGDMLPLNNEMPLSMYEAKKTFSALGMEYQKIHACPNDFILYRNQYKDAIACPTCGKSRWKINNEGGGGGEDLEGGSCKGSVDKECDGKLRHPSDSSAWKLVDHMWPDFASEPRNLRLALSTDGPRQPGKNIDVYLSPLVDDLKTLWEKGVETYDAHLHEVPEGYCSNFRNLVSLEELKLFGLKSHDYHALLQQLLPVALRSVLPKHFYFRWMYPFERYMKVLKGYVRNHNRPEGCIAECYLAEETVEFCTEYLSGTHAIGIPKSNNYDNKFGRPITGGRSTNIDHKLWLQAHHYVLENTTIIQPYIDLNTLNNLRDKFGLQEEHMRCFTYWLKGKVEEAIHNGQDIPNTLRWLAHGPTHQVVKYLGYIINGCRYHTKERDMTCVTQNSGVSILAGTMQIASSKDKNLVFGELCFYGVIKEIWDLDYNMFRIPIFKCDWVDNKNASQAKQVFYVEDQLDPKWSIVLSIPPKDFNNMEGLDDFTDNCMEHHPFISSMPEVESFDVMDESEAIYMREDCEGIWIENN
ncbi:hypothetical protein CK203_103040 [Vitis vinifera]|uniref:DUF4218 domain-containing protein n=1 Tax=Vitis vinifera TaxID=29760 RepID=A0A438DLG1_VITVI|nr:hypothetical protein CK203_103040 [Vitis vinifera]